MNRIYRLVFNRSLGVLQVASEVAAGHAGSTGGGAARLAAPLLPFALACALAAPAYASGVPSLSSATGATVSQNGGTLQIDQNAAKAVLNWNSFNVGKDASVVFVQPSSSAVALNLIDASRGASVIDGSLRANGNVFLINSAGILFGNHAQVNVGGLVASSLGLAGDDDHGYLLARGEHGAASVINQGSIRAGNGGSVNLVGNHVANRGSITADGGAIRLLSADQVRVTMDAAGAIGMQMVAAASQSVDGAAAAVENSGSLRANGGQILLQAGSTGLSQLLVNNTGALEATGIDTSGGSVRLVGSGGDVASSGRIDVSGPHGGSVQVLSDGAVNVDGRIDASGTAAGGSIRIGGGYQGGEQLQHASAATVASGARLDASATGQGNGGSVVVWSDGHTAVHGTLRANAAGSGNGGLLETSGHTVDFSGIAVGAKAAGPGSAGTWLVDPEDLTVDSAAASTISGALNGGTNVTLLSTLTNASGPGNVSSGAGDINVNAAIGWSGNSTLTLDAYHSIHLNAAVTATGDTAGLVLNYGGYTENGSVGGTGDYYVNAPVSLGGAHASLSINGQAYRLIHSLADAATYFNTPGSYALAQDIDLSGVTRSSALVSSFQSKLAGLGHSINNLTISGASGYVGLFGTTSSNSVIRDLHLGNVSVSGGYYVGGLVGYGQGAIKNVTVDGSVTGTSGGVGGLTGYNLGLIDNGAFTGNVNGQSAVGGLAGNNISGTIRNSHSTGSVTGSSSNTGGLVGYNDGGSLTNTYSTSNVSGTNSVGGLVGTNQNAGTIQNSYASGSVIGTSYGVGGLVGMNYQSAIANTYATGSVTAPTSVGGLVGINNPGSAAVTSSSVSNSYATGAVNGTNNVGGLIGANTGSVSNASWDVGSTGQANAISNGGSGSVTNLTSFGSGNRYSHTSYGNLGNWALLAGSSNVYVASDGNGNPAWIMIEGQTRPFLASEYSTTIGNAHQLQLMAYNLAASYSLSADIDASQTAGSNASGMWSSAGFSPVGDSTGAFTGSLNGANHTIAGLTIARGGASYVGLFGNTGLASQIGNLALTGATVVGTAYVGGVAGFNAGTLSGISVNGTMSGTGNFVGGLTGYNNAGTIAGVQTSGTVVGSGGPYSGNYVGGLIGSNANGTISASSSSSTVSGGSSVGGLVGNDYQGSYTNAFATGNVSSTSTTTGNNVGGLIGNAIQSTLQNVHATGNVTATTSSAGGLVGMAGAGSIQNAYASGNVSGTRSVGGLVGRSSATIDTAYATGAVNGAANGTSSELGGLVGTLDHGSLASTHATGNVSGGSFVGGLVGYSDTGSVGASYATGAVSGTNYLGGLVGYNDGGSIGNAYATGNVSGDMYVAGLAGYNDNGTIANTYASGDATGTAYVGGLVGVNYNNTVRNSYATGNVSGTGAVGGLVGSNSNGSIVASFFATDIGGNPRNVGLNTVGNSGGSIDAISGGRSWSALNTLSTFTDAGWAIDDRGGTGLTWRLYEQMGTPLLRSFLTPLTITTGVSGLDKTYDGNAVSGTLASYTIGGAFDPGLLFGSSLRYATTGNGVGRYTTGNGTLQLGGLASSQQGYDIAYVVSGGISITPATLTVTATSGSKTYGGTANLGGYSVSGLVGNDTVSGVALSSAGAGSGAAVGNYAITASGATGAGLSNYVVSYVDGSLRVDPATLRIVATDANKTYGGTANLSGYSVSGLLNGDTVAGVALGSAGAAAGAAVGTYAITASGATGAGLSNYVVTYVDGSLRVDPATLRIVASDASKTVGSTATLSGYRVSGLLNGDTVAGVALDSAGAGANAAVGNYAITASGATGAGLSNYAITYVDGLLNVVPGSGDGGGAGTQLTTTAVQAINTSVAVATTSDAVGAAPTHQQKADEAAKELAAATQASGGGTVTAATDSILIVDGGIRAPSVACTPSGTSNASADSCIIRQ
ncbi:filamentous hemagglutinin N-terminal domain-containing protein [Xanthomonas sp. PPL568]|uniref:GLUG motif-containing protein n=1 Tax=Xanthomonas indica TaxID=2912242 RepID=UPI001F560243|nr:GLUG motif-containing protein [Xanthomonas indica]MCI2243084.1 filamentous hemagglutinin N-terminal domain-containing protein [Xanthomonas indica]